MSALNFQGPVTFGGSEQGKYVYSLACGVEQSGRINLVLAPCIFAESLRFINQQMHI